MCVCAVVGLQDAAPHRHPTVQTVRFTSLRDALGGVFASTCCGFCCLASAMWMRVYRSNWGLLVPDRTPICPNASTLSNMMFLCVSGLRNFECAYVLGSPPMFAALDDHDTANPSSGGFGWWWCTHRVEASPWQMAQPRRMELITGAHSAEAKGKARSRKLSPSPHHPEGTCMMLTAEYLGMRFHDAGIDDVQYFASHRTG